jgi:AAA15 family ATPase/GTPase
MYPEVAVKIKSLEISNFRSIREAKINMADFNAFVGPNGSGKSTALHALNLFFGDMIKIEESDFHRKNTNEPIVVRVVFESLGESAIEDFKHYVRAAY